jgi:hypothetical protein
VLVNPSGVTVENGTDEGFDVAEFRVRAEDKPDHNMTFPGFDELKTEASIEDLFRRPSIKVNDVFGMVEELNIGNLLVQNLANVE